MEVAPYLMFNGNCEEALNFYAKCLNGKIEQLMRFEGSPAAEMATNKQDVLHAIFKAGDFMMMASDTTKDGATETDGGKVHLSLNFHSEEEIDRVYNALSEGGRQTMPLDDTFWGARFGMCTDKYGINWMFNYDKPGAKPEGHQ